MSVKSIRFRPLAAICAVVAITFGIYAQTYGHDFILLDDYNYVVSNSWVRIGLSLRGFVWAFTTFTTGNWHPLTWLSLMADVSLFGVNPGGHHLVNAVLHCANVLLLFVMFSRMTGAPWRSGFVAAVFALHPLHVESVAWISERKDLLCAVFFLSTLLCYERYVRRPGLRRYLPVVAVFLLALLSKPMAVTLPFALLLMDYWPLGRFSSLRSGVSLVLEKIPLFLISATFGFVTVAAQAEGNMVVLAALPHWARVANAVRCYGIYILESILPTSLAVFYPHPGTAVDFREVVAAAILLGCLTAMAVRLARKRGYLMTGWLWYLGMMVPVIGLVQVGGQAMADRYMYLPLIGLSVMAAWGVPGLVDGRGSKWRVALLSSTVLSLALLAAGTWRQVGYWRNSITLFSRTVEVTSGNAYIRTMLGAELANKGRYDEGIVHLQEVLRSNPGFGTAHNSLAIALFKKGRFDEAEMHFRDAARFSPWKPDGLLGEGLVALQQKRLDEAASDFQGALAIDPGNPDAKYYLGRIRQEEGDLDGAIDQYRKALKLTPDAPDVLCDLAVALDKKGNRTEAIRTLEDAVRIAPENVAARYLLGHIYFLDGRSPEAVSQLEAASRLAPGDPEVSNLLSAARKASGTKTP